MKSKILPIAVLIFGAVLASSTLAAQQELAPSSSQINVALYPYVPRLEQFKETILATWEKMEPNIHLNFVDQKQWDGGYSIDPTDKIDVFVFESLFLEYFQNQGYLAALQENDIDGLKDIPDYIVNDIKIDGKIYGIPQTGCFNLLFYRSDDKELEQAKSLEEIYHVIGKCPYQSLKPPRNQGLIVNLSDEIMTTGLYLDAVEDLGGQYTPTPALPPKEQLNPEAIAQLQKLLSLSSRQQAKFEETEPYQRASWFAQGFGRAMIGFSESVLAMTEVQEKIAFKFIPLSTKPTDIPLLYVEMVGINPLVKQRGLWKMALKAANLLTSQSVMITSLAAKTPDETPQYLIPMRTSVFATLKQRYSLYERIHRLMTNQSLRVFRMGTHSRSWLNTTKDAINQQIFAAACN